MHGGANGTGVAAGGCWLTSSCMQGIADPRGQPPAALAYCMIALICLWLSLMLTWCFHSAAASGTGNANATAAALAASSEQISPLYTDP